MVLVDGLSTENGADHIDEIWAVSGNDRGLTWVETLVTCGDAATKVG